MFIFSNLLTILLYFFIIYWFFFIYWYFFIFTNLTIWYLIVSWALFNAQFIILRYIFDLLYFLYISDYDSICDM